MGGTPDCRKEPVLALPYVARTQTTETVNGKPVTRTTQQRRTLFIAPSSQTIDTRLDPEVRTRGSIHRTVVYDAAIKGEARVAMPDDLDRLGIDPADLMLNEAIIQLPISDPRGLQTDARLTLAGERLDLRPGLGTGGEGTGVHAFLDWGETDERGVAGGEITLDFAYSLRGSSAFSLVPRGEETDLSVKSSWPHPSFAGNFLPSERNREI
ncbi:MAG: inner membrane CreD family protein, partial [Erythrobacter sp.]|nr:inner membrane CreD family protein [Erythrobacter sp.]